MESFAFLLMPGFSAMAFFSAVEPLRIANRLAGQTLYRWSVHTPSGDHARASNAMEIRADGPMPEGIDAAVVCAGFDPLDRASPALLGQLRRIWRGGARLGAIDTGAFVLAEAGVLGREPITLHWEAAEDFRHRYPRIPVSSELYERHARLFTCAGGTAAMDMMLEAISARHGAALAKAVGDQLIHDRIRPPTAPQRASLVQQAGAAGAAVQRVIAAMERGLGSAMPLEAILDQARVSRRRAERLLRAELGVAPARLLRALRIRHVLDLVRSSGMPLHEAALAVGFSSSSVFSRACRQQFGASPRELLAPGAALPEPFRPD